MADRADCRGFCRRCGHEHSLPAAPALDAARELMAALAAAGRIDFDRRAEGADPRCTTDYLFGPARGKMFGVLTGRSATGAQVVLKAFSGQYNGLWQVPGWAGPLFDLQAFHRVHDAEERAIKELGRRMEKAPTEQRQELAAQRRARSRQLMEKLHRLYQVRNFRGEEAGLAAIFGPGQGIPTGTGDCCAPRLLQQAVLQGIHPRGLAEFYWGAGNPSGSREHGLFYGSCHTKCYPLLGFMLCGLEASRAG
jgi:hypothetical protein